VNVPIYTGGSVPAAMDAAAASLTSRQIEARVAQLDLKLRIAEQYVAVLRAHSDVARAEISVQSLASHLHDVEMLFQHDQRPRNDVLAAQVALAEARHDLVTAENRLDVARATYNRGLSRPLDQRVFLYDLTAQPPLGELEAVTQLAVENREELGQLRAQARALQLEAESILAKNRPQAAITGGYVFQENRFQSPEGITSLGVGVTWNLYDAGRDRHRATALQRQASALCRMRDDLESHIRLEVRRAWLDVEETAQRLKVTHDALGQSEENLRVARQRYTNAMGTNTDVLTAESQRVRSFRNHHHAYYDAILAAYRLRRALGCL
jgi:outer membrane protein TolC